MASTTWPAGPPPEGYTPVVGFKFCPPGGIYFDLALWLIDCFNDVVQVCTFTLNQDYAFAVSCSFFIIYTIWTQITLTKVSPFTEALKSVDRGVPTLQWSMFTSFEQQIEAPGTGLVAPYGMSVDANLGMVGAASGMLGLFLSAKAIAAGWIGVQAGDWGMIASKPTLYKAVFMSALVGFACELSSTALASSVLHPLIVITSLALCPIVNLLTVEADNLPRSEKFYGMLVTPSLAFRPLSSVSIFGRKKGFFSNSSRPIISEGLIALRILAWGAMACTLQLPHGLAPFGSLGRPMGSRVLWEDYVDPTRTVVTAASACGNAAMNYIVAKFQGETPAPFQCALPQSSHLSPGAMIFRAGLVGTVLVTVPLYFVLLMLILVCLPSYRNQVADQDLEEEVTAKQGKIEDWGNENLQAEWVELTMVFQNDTEFESWSVERNRHIEEAASKIGVNLGDADDTNLQEPNLADADFSIEPRVWYNGQYFPLLSEQYRFELHERESINYPLTVVYKFAKKKVYTCCSVVDRKHAHGYGKISVGDE